MARLREHIGQILEELRRIQAADHLSSALDGGIPGLIASNRGSVIVNGKIEHKIGAVAVELSTRPA